MMKQQPRRIILSRTTGFQVAYWEGYAKPYSLIIERVNGAWFQQHFASPSELLRVLEAHPWTYEHAEHHAELARLFSPNTLRICETEEMARRAAF